MLPECLMIVQIPIKLKNENIILKSTIYAFMYLKYHWYLFTICLDTCINANKSFSPYFERFWEVLNDLRKWCTPSKSCVSSN